MISRIAASLKPTSDNKYRLSASASIQYLDYLELKEARDNAKQAMRFSWGAIGIAIITLIAQIYSNL